MTPGSNTLCANRESFRPFIIQASEHSFNTDPLTYM